jgi:hypothetical protein
LDGVTNSTRLAVLQLEPPRLEPSPPGAVREFHFTPVPGWTHTLERTTNFSIWSEVESVRPENRERVTLEDPAPPSSPAFYRLRLARL